eukprot:5910784-Amphidinium_carterae.2
MTDSMNNCCNFSLAKLIMSCSCTHCVKCDKDESMKKACKCIDCMAVATAFTLSLSGQVLATAPLARAEASIWKLEP